jgi:peptidoglycan/LPS O-acetylase OafA/YrhL
MMETGEAISPATFAILVQAVTARLLTMFLAGVLVYLFRDQIPASWPLVAGAMVIVAVSTLLPSYRLLAAIPLAYVLMVSGALIRLKWLQLPTDLSYGVYIYGFPLQQLLLVAGLSVHPILFAAISIVVTLPVAALSWFFIEKPSLGLKRRLEQVDSRQSWRSVRRSERAMRRRRGRHQLNAATAPPEPAIGAPSRRLG